MTDSFDAEAELLRHGTALRALAVALVGDRDAAEVTVTLPTATPR